MDALILAAGEGTRLRPLTYTRPKPLLPILNRPLLQWTLEYLSRFSVDRAILNTHHLAGQFETTLPALDRGGIRELVTRFEPRILNTGGGLVNARDFFKSDPFVVISGDILTDIDLKMAVDFHQSHNDPVTLVLHDYPEFNQIKVNPDGRILKFRTGYGHGLDFTNIHILDQNVFRFLPSSGSFDIVAAYQQMIDEGITIRAYVSQGHHWWNIGTPASYLKVHEELLSTPSLTLPPLRGRAEVGGLSKQIFELLPPDEIMKDKGTERFKRILIHPEAVIEPGVEFSGWACIGKGCRLKTGCRIRNSVLWEDVMVEKDVSIAKSIIGQGVHLKDNLRSGVIV